MRFHTFTILSMMLLMTGCASQRHDREIPTTQTAPTLGPILYHRTGGVANTDDRVVIWPDGFVTVRGKILADNQGWLTRQRVAELNSILKDWPTLRDDYSAQNVDDAYTIAITYGGKTVTGSDLAADLPERFRKAFVAIEAAAGQISAQPPAAAAP